MNFSSMALVSLYSEDEWSALLMFSYNMISSTNMSNCLLLYENCNKCSFSSQSSWFVSTFFINKSTGSSGSSIK